MFILSLCLWLGFFMETGFGEMRVYLTYLLVLFESVMVSLCLSKFKLSRNSLFVGVMYLLLRTVFGYCLGLDAGVEAASAAVPNSLFGVKAVTYVPLLLLWAIYYLLKMYEAEFSLPALLNGAVLWSLAALIVPSLVYTLPCIFLILLIYAANRGRVWGVALLSLSLPFAALGIWDFLNDTTLLKTWFSQVPSIRPQLPYPITSLAFYFTLMVLIVAFLGRMYLKQNPIEGEILERKRSGALAAVFIYFLLFFVIVGGRAVLSTMPLLFPTAYLIGDYFTRKKETLFQEGLFAVLLIIGILIMCV